MKKTFKIAEGKGFQVTFQNGWTVSVQFGYECNTAEDMLLILREIASRPAKLSSEYEQVTKQECDEHLAGL